MSGSVICPACKGNGYIGSSKETDTQTDCHTFVKIKGVLI
jgi:hypothetical protein